jgi:hypothetical protein
MPTHGILFVHRIIWARYIEHASVAFGNLIIIRSIFI